VTAGAKLDIAPHVADGFRKMAHLFLFCFEQVQYQAQGCFFANARQFSKFGYGIFE
jgi:hypothetical protein